MVRGRGDPVRIVVIDDSPTVRDMLLAILQNAQDMQVVGAGANGEEALKKLDEYHRQVLAATEDNG